LGAGLRNPVLLHLGDTNDRTLQVDGMRR
jgi:hypothetical protein